jgi:hypothetical protein
LGGFRVMAPAEAAADAVAVLREAVDNPLNDGEILEGVDHPFVVGACLAVMFVIMWVLNVPTVFRVRIWRERPAAAGMVSARKP